jgi:hypothetical protein
MFHKNIDNKRQTYAVYDAYASERNTTDFKQNNPACKYYSSQHSVKMSDVSDLCEWHRLRMAKHIIEKCGCGQCDVCIGDSTGRHIFRDYYNRWDMPVIDSSGLMYCCSGCQNADRETHMCGDMRVGKCCISKHQHARPIKNQDEDEDEDEDEEDEDENELVEIQDNGIDIPEQEEEFIVIHTPN